MVVVVEEDTEMNLKCFLYGHKNVVITGNIKHKYSHLICLRCHSKIDVFPMLKEDWGDVLSAEND